MATVCGKSWVTGYGFTTGDPLPVLPGDQNDDSGLFTSAGPGLHGGWRSSPDIVAASTSRHTGRPSFGDRHATRSPALAVPRVDGEWTITSRRDDSVLAVTAGAARNCEAMIVSRIQTGSEASLFNEAPM
jgi:hypothetical protein